MTTEDLPVLARTRQRCSSGAARAIRMSAGVSLSEVAAACGVSFSTVWRWEHGQRAPHGEPGLLYGRLLDDLLGARQ